MKRSALQNKQLVILRMAFGARKVLGTFEKRAHGRVHNGYRSIYLMLFACDAFLLVHKLLKTMRNMHFKNFVSTRS